MPPSLRWLLLLLGLGILAAAAAIGVQQWQRQTQRQDLAVAHTSGDPEAGRAALYRYGCGGCHRISGIPGARGRVGPALDGLAQRAYIAGRLPNEPEDLIRWIRNPPGVDPQTAMPELGVEAADARDIAAYLYTLSPGWN